MTLLADDHLSLASDPRHLGHPAGKCVRLVDARPLLLEVVFFPADEEHYVGVLFDGATVAKVRKMRALALAFLDLARELRERQDWDTQLLGQRLESSRDFRDLLDAV